MARIASAARVDDERDLIGRCVRGEDGAWAALVREYEPRVQQVVSRSGALDDVEDLEQEVWARLWTANAAALRTLRAADARTLRAFIGKVARSVAIDHVRSRRVASQQSAASTTEAIADGAPTPEGALGAEEEKRRFSWAVREAARTSERPGRDADILRLHFEDGLSASEISEMRIGLEPRGVEAVLRRAKARIEQLLRADEKP
jgi:RNA polymerase sigma factor (sigma-70 family)